eukprot:5199051-Pyramimonas_sp.AAC.1
MKLGLNLSLSACNTFALPVTSHVAQCYAPSPLILNKAHEGLQRLTNAPRLAFVPVSLHHRKTLGLECEAHDLKIMAPAAMLRAAIRSKAFDRMCQCLSEIQEYDDHCVAPLARCPGDKSIIACMKRVH